VSSRSEPWSYSTPSPCRQNAALQLLLNAPSQQHFHYFEPRNFRLNGERGNFQALPTPPHVQQMVAFAGIDPKLRNCGQHQAQVHISKRGPRYLRRALYLACQGVVRNDDYFHSIYQRHRDKGKSHKEAIITVMNRFIHVLYAIWRDNRPYYPLTQA